MESVQAIKLQRQRQENRRAIVYHVGVLAVCLLMLYPLIWLFSSSLKAPDEVWTTVTSLIPRGLHFENYVNGWQGFGGISFATTASASYPSARRSFSAS